MISMYFNLLSAQNVNKNIESEVPKPNKFQISLQQQKPNDAQAKICTFSGHNVRYF